MIYDHLELKFETLNSNLSKVLEQLKAMNILLGSINQNIVTLIKPIGYDVEISKNHLNKIRKMDTSYNIRNDNNPPASVGSHDGEIKR